MMHAAYGTVTALDPTNYRVFVLLEGVATGQGPTVPVDIGTHGPRTPLLIHQSPLPTVGTRGVVLFPRADPRNGVWICSVAGPLNSASTTRPGFAQVKYDSEWSGYWHLRDNGGNEVVTWPDGSSLTVGTAPVPTRTVLSPSQAPVQQTFGQAQRVATPPSPFPLTLKTASGVTISTDVSGNVTIQVPSTSQVVNIGGLGETLHKLVTDVFVSLFNSHTHGNVQPGGSNTGPPTPTMTSADLTTVLTAG